ncbi:MAG TPA: c-type cytochrome [Acetobacteraceae bacterium]|nr:c-type cytochrome [Acetobacteraceae bacterium]
MMTIVQESQWSSRMMRALIAGLLLAGFATGSLAADPAAGQKVFNTQCGICRSASEGKNGLGPSLFDVVGRRAGSVPDFNYTADHKKLGISWTTAALDKYLTNPRAMVPDTSMIYPGLKDNAQRANLIAYLATLH